ncbi:indole-3-glycerol phosphate synthase TrpC [Paenibacillus dokdonensis]|uniref:Indole-3-glycerol phosphate synthase n=1 Tax=Paenibacillus dokdonensis TaxID=2567944 RepID=A0ABU6GYS2_9BACL|nr:indole-3-glycerol phosphate synthase TrpC [Paenibacillus dokdonensis]MEC0243322.1 indole-3-glycerol phosphate synthase TrpC [Paenibacillus dokdonensis]
MYLDRIVETKREETAKLAECFSIDEALETISGMPATKGFARTLTAGRKRDMGLIAEVKKASPSKGLIRPDFDPVQIALAYEKAGADCLSVLTDTTYFHGSGEYLKAVRQAVNLPLLRKDFVIDERQIYEARLLGADAVLLIAAILTPEQISLFMKTAASIGLDSLIEVHSLEEMNQVLKLELHDGALIGINNRNLHTFETSLAATEMLSKLVPEGVPVISESGIAGPQDMEFLRKTGASGVLVGEYFMRQEDIAAAVRSLMGPVPKEGGVHLHG